MTKSRIFFGTNNPHKLREIHQIIGSKYEVLSFKDLDEPIDVEETEPTLEGNAALKAKAFYEHTGMPCFADDTGLEVASLDGRPGVFSARYAGPACSSEDNIDKMLGELAGNTARRAHFRTVIAYYDGAEMRYFEGIAKGNILPARQGEGGFGYDPIFQPEGFSTSFAEMSPDEKNAISHRGKAVRAFAEFLLGG
jgi:XTP/dITP diphosphohydrolase